MKKFLILIAAFVVLTACEDFLTETPKNQISVDQYFDKPEDARAAVNALYRTGSGANSYGSGGFRGSNVMIGSFMSGLFDNEAKGERIEGQLAHSLQQDPVNFNDYAGGWWNAMYQAVNRANLAIDRIPGIPGMNPAERDRILAEARYFRAHNYFTLVRYFGDVPLVLQPVEGLEGAFVTRESSATVYNQIIQDLEWARDNGNLSNVPFESGNNGRITHGTVLALLADVHLQRAGHPMMQNDGYGEAATTARAIIQSGVYSLIQHGADPMTQSAYNIMRTSQTEAEYIWSVEYDGDIASSQYPRITVPGAIRPPGIMYSRTLNMFRPITAMVNMYDPENDLRIQNRQLFATSIEVDGQEYQFGEYVPFVWFEEGAVFGNARGTRNLNHVKYSEILLIAAEAIARSQGVNAEAVGYLADVRARAYWNTDRAEIEASLIGLSADAFVEQVWTERYRELALDFKQWHDIQRTRKYPVTNPDNPGVVQYVDVVGANNNWGVQFRERDLLYPIPDAEMQRNENLVQNPGY